MNSSTNDEQLATSPSPQTFALLGVLVTLGVIERIYGIDRQGLWSDELFAVMASYKPSFSDILPIVLGDSHPPGYLMFMYATLPVTGYSDLGVRLHSFLFGLLWIPLTFLLAWRWFGSCAGLLAAALMASAYNAVYYSQEARAYAMLVVACIVSVHCLLECLLGEQYRRRHRAGFVLSTLAMLYLHYTGFVFLCAMALLYAMLWLFRMARCSMRDALVLFALPFVLYLPWLGVMYGHMTAAPQDWSVSAVPTIREAWNVLHRLFGPDDSHMTFYVTMLSVCLAAAMVSHVRYGLSSGLKVTYALFFLLIVPVLAYYVESLLGTPILEKRYLLPALPLSAVLIGALISQWLACFGKSWRKPAGFAVVLAFSVWTIAANIQFGLYSKNDKDAIREAVQVVRDDVSRNPGQRYGMLMTHNWFEHYLRRAQLRFDEKWPYRLFYVPEQFSYVREYLDKRKKMQVFYYLSLRQQNAEAAVVALRQQYRLLAKVPMASETGVIDVFKFSAKEQPTAQDNQDLASSPLDDIASGLARDLGSKDPATYLVLTTHDWIDPYLQRHGIVLRNDGLGRRYVIDAQAEAVTAYLSQHPAIDTVYYLALDEPNANSAAFMLQSRYLLQSERAVRVSVGNVLVLKFDTKSPAVASDSLHARMVASPVGRLVQSLQTNIAHDSVGDHYDLVMSHSLFEPYVERHGILLDKSRGSRFYVSADQLAAVRQHIQTHPALDYLYFLMVGEDNLMPALKALQQEWMTGCQQTLDAAIGKLYLVRLDVRKSHAAQADPIPACAQ